MLAVRRTERKASLTTAHASSTKPPISPTESAPSRLRSKAVYIMFGEKAASRKLVSRPRSCSDSLVNCSSNVNGCIFACRTKR